MNQADNRATLCCQRSQWTGFQRSRGFMRRIGMTISGEPSPVARGSVAEQDADRVPGVLDDLGVVDVRAESPP
jgi:hypothetical protein